MFAIGDSLREARTRRGLSPADVQKGLRIRERYLTALEEERWELLPGEAYIKGFLRQYAEFLGLDGNLYIEEYTSRFLHREEEPFVPDSLAPRTRRTGVLRLLGVVAVVLAAVAGLAAWQLSGTTSTAKAPSLGAADATAAVQPAAMPKPAVKPAPAPAPEAKPKPAVAVLSAARGRTWLSVRAGGVDGKVLFQGILEQGETLRFGVKQRLWVRMGRPWLLDIRLAGRLVGGLPNASANILLTRAGAQAA
jgi:cytoskeletal protein RodZ